jgi:ribose/xylose/arabinose/galactoside ABC-type transport system permease subunit
MSKRRVLKVPVPFLLLQLAAVVVGLVLPRTAFGTAGFTIGSSGRDAGR